MIRGPSEGFLFTTFRSMGLPTNATNRDEETNCLSWRFRWSSSKSPASWTSVKTAGTSKKRPVGNQDKRWVSLVGANKTCQHPSFSLFGSWMIIMLQYVGQPLKVRSMSSGHLFTKKLNPFGLKDCNPGLAARETEQARHLQGAISTAANEISTHLPKYAFRHGHV